MLSPVVRRDVTPLVSAVERCSDHPFRFPVRRVIEVRTHHDHIEEFIGAVLRVECDCVLDVSPPPRVGFFEREGRCGGVGEPVGGDGECCESFESPEERSPVHVVSTRSAR